MQPQVKQRITPFLWFNDNAEEALEFYCSLFPNSRITKRSYYGEAGPGPRGTLMVASYELEGQEFMAINGGPQFQFTEAISFVINCTTQEEIDRLWQQLSEGGQESRCGWVKDRFGLWWQVVPVQLGQLMSSGSAAQSNAVMNAMLQMGKLNIALLQDAFERLHKPTEATSAAIEV